MFSYIVIMFFFIDQTRLLEGDKTLESSSGLTTAIEGAQEHLIVNQGRSHGGL